MAIDHTQNEYYKLNACLKELKAIALRENKRHMMDQHLTPSMLSLLEYELIPLLENELDYDGGDSYDEPPMTLDEIHTAAFKEHQELHR